MFYYCFKSCSNFYERNIRNRCLFANHWNSGMSTIEIGLFAISKTNKKPTIRSCDGKTRFLIYCQIITFFSFDISGMPIADIYIHCILPKIIVSPKPNWNKFYIFFLIFSCVCGCVFFLSLDASFTEANFEVFALLFSSKIEWIAACSETFFKIFFCFCFFVSFFFRL